MSRQKKQLYIDATPLMGDNPSGIGKVLLSHIIELTQDNDFMDRYDVTLFVSLGKTHTLKKWQFRDNIRTQEIPLPLRAINLLVKLKIMPPIDLYLGRGIYLFGNYRRLPLAGSKSITFVYDAVYDKFPETVQPKNLSYLQKVIPYAFRKSDTVLTLTAESERELAAIFPSYASRIRVVPCGIDRRRYMQRSQSQVDTTLKKVGVRKNNFLLYVGNIEPRKNINYLLDVYLELIRQKSISASTALVLVGGDGWNNEPLLKRIEELTAQNVKIVRPRNRLTDQEIADLYATTSLTCLFSIHEGFGITPLEALAAGSRVVVSDIPVLREVNGDAVTYVTLDNPVKAAQQIATALNQKPNNRAIESTLDTYTWHNAAKELTRYIDEL